LHNPYNKGSKIMNGSILQLNHITKIYPGVVALDDVSMKFQKGEIHAIVGENGAGKSTFIKVITGAIQPSEGEIVFEEHIIENNNPIKSLNNGITAIYQEFNLIPYLSVAENIFFGRYIKKEHIVDFNEMERQTKRILDELEINLNPKTQVKNLSVGYRQIVEVAKSISRNIKVLVLDEPTAPLTNDEVKHLFKIVKKLKEQGICIIYISHRLEEIFEICDKVSVFRDGKHIKTMNVSETSVNELVYIMVNRKTDQQFPHADYQRGEKVLEVKNLNTVLLKNISFEAYRGEIIGLAGLVGAGRTEVARAIFGADKIVSGEIYLKGKKLDIRLPKDAVAAGIGLIPEDRKLQGVLLKMSVIANTSYAHMKAISKVGIIDKRKDMKTAEKYIEVLNIKTPSVNQQVRNLSGGNQQKVVLAKWLFTNCEVLIFDEPTRGVDVGAKHEIYELMRRMVKEGKVIIMISSEMSEILGMADRIIVMHEGSMAGIIEGSEKTQENVLLASSGLTV
jgi:ribose transport system ATP-binding protein